MKKRAAKVSRRVFLEATGAAALGTFTSGCARSVQPAFAGTQAERRPNIILAMADDQGWGEMAYNGHPDLHTPHFDAMAASGVRFDRFYSAAPVCSPTRGSVMTGRHPNRFGCFKWGYSLRPQEVSVGEALKRAGYVTGHFGKWHLGSVLAGSPVNPGAAGFDEWFSAYNFFDNDAILSREGVAVQTQGESSMVTVDAAIEFISKHAGGGQPFLAVVWFGSPHRPHRALAEDLERYRGLDKKKAALFAEVTAMDRAFGKLRDELCALGVHENTLLWYCSDNGGLPESGATGGREQKGSIYEGGLRVPALLEWPARRSRPAVVDTPCVTSDIMPTLLQITGASIGDNRPLDGVSLAPALENPDWKRPRGIGFWDYPIKGIGTPSDEWMKELLAEQAAGQPVADKSRLRLDAAEIGDRYKHVAFQGHAAWLEWPWKLHRIEPKEGGEPVFELYNLADDPREADNLAANQPKRVAAMTKSLDRWHDSVLRSLNGKDYAR